MSLVYLNGELLDRSVATIPLDDRGFYFGDGVYEVVRVVDGRTFAAEAHRIRLERSLRETSIEPPAALLNGGMEDLCRRMVEANGLSAGHATVYLQVTRGSAPRTHGFPPPGTPATLFASSAPFEIPRRLRTEGAAAITLPDIRWTRCDIKSINLLPNVLAKQSAAEAGAFEALFVRDAVLTEGASSNLFGVMDGVLRTFPLGNLILGGVTRAIVLELAAEAGVDVVEEPLSIDDLARVDERLDEDTVEAVISELRAEYDAGERSFQVYEVAGGYQILTG